MPARGLWRPVPSRRAPREVLGVHRDHVIVRVALLALARGHHEAVAVGGLQVAAVLRVEHVQPQRLLPPDVAQHRHAARRGAREPAVQIALDLHAVRAQRDGEIGGGDRHARRGDGRQGRRVRSAHARRLRCKRRARRLGRRVRDERRRAWRPLLLRRGALVLGADSAALVAHAAAPAPLRALVRLFVDPLPCVLQPRVDHRVARAGGGGRRLGGRGGAARGRRGRVTGRRDRLRELGRRRICLRSGQAAEHRRGLEHARLAALARHEHG